MIVGVRMFMTCRYADNELACITCGQGYVALYVNPNHILTNTVCWSHILGDRSRHSHSSVRLLQVMVSEEDGFGDLRDA